MDIIEACHKVFKSLPVFKNWKTVERWMVLYKCVFGLPLDDAEWAIAQHHTGRSERPTGRFDEVWIRVGRRGGKTLFTAIAIVYLAAFHQWNIQVGLGYILFLAADKKQASVLMAYVKDIFRLPLLKGLVEKETAEELFLKNRVVISIHTASYRSTRGYRILCAACDEIAFWRNEDSSNPASEVLTALMPALGENPGSMLWVISTPYSRTGPFYSVFKDKHGTDDPHVLTWVGTTLEHNPTYSARVIERARHEDAAAAAAEFDAAYRDDLEAFISREMLEAVVVRGRFELPRLDGVQYVAWCDPSSGRQDSMTLAVAHYDRVTQKSVLDVLREKRPPFQPEGAIAEFAATMKSFGLTRVWCDRYAVGYVQDAFQRHGISVQNSDTSASDIYLAWLPHVANGTVELLDNKTLVAQLAGLERRTGRLKDTVDHGPAAHDDLAAATSGAMLKTAKPAVERKIVWL